MRPVKCGECGSAYNPATTPHCPACKPHYGIEKRMAKSAKRKAEGTLAGRNDEDVDRGRMKNGARHKVSPGGTTQASSSRGIIDPFRH